MRVVVTGASGFIGSNFISTAVAKGLDVVGLNRDQLTGDPGFAPGDMVVHCAGVTKVRNRSHKNQREAYEGSNVALTVDLARQAADAGARKFIFLSSIAVLGDFADNNAPFNATSPFNPVNLYGHSKKKAEELLTREHGRGPLQLYYVRPPMVYGPKSGNIFGLLSQAIKRNIPLPFGNFVEKRSLIGVRNLADYLIACCFDPDEQNAILHPADAELLSTREFIENIAAALGTDALLFKLPKRLLKLAAVPLGMSDLIERINKPLIIDSASEQVRLPWSPPYSTGHELNYAIS